MHIPWPTDIVIFAQHLADAAAPAAQDEPKAAPQGGFGDMFIPLIGIFAIFYFLIIRPQSKKQKERDQKVKSARKGDTVLTHGGIYGKIVKDVKEADQDILVEVDKHSKTRIRFTRTAVLDILDRGAVEEASQSSEDSAEDGQEEAPPIPGS